MEKYQNTRDNEDLWSIARAIEIGEMRTENHYKEGVEAALIQGRQEGMEQGIKQGIERGVKQGIDKGKQQERFNMAVQFIKVKFNKDESTWLSTLTFEQLQCVNEALIFCDSIEEVKKTIK